MRIWIPCNKGAQQEVWHRPQLRVWYCARGTRTWSGQQDHAGANRRRWSSPSQGSDVPASAENRHSRSKRRSGQVRKEDAQRARATDDCSTRARDPLRPAASSVRQTWPQRTLNARRWRKHGRNVPRMPTLIFFTRDSSH